MKGSSSASIWITFFAIVMLFSGIFAGIRTGANLYFFKDRYPQGGVLAINTSGQPAYYQRESDCNYPPSAPSYDLNGKLVSVSPEQEKIDKQNKDNCLVGVKDTREQAKINDIAVSLLLLFLGGGVLATRKIIVA